MVTCSVRLTISKLSFGASTEIVGISKGGCGDIAGELTIDEDELSVSVALLESNFNWASASRDGTRDSTVSSGGSGEVAVELEAEAVAELAGVISLDGTDGMGESGRG